jgi:hypothetical protein
MGLIMTREEIEIILTRLEQMMRDLTERVNEIDERTRQFKKFTQTGHPDFDLG